MRASPELSAWGLQSQVSPCANLLLGGGSVCVDPVWSRHQRCDAGVRGLCGRGCLFSPVLGFIGSYFGWFWPV